LALLDVGGGTGDIAFGVLAKAACDVTVCDINAEMLAVGRDRAVDQGLLSGPFWTCGNAEQLPVPDETMDVYVTAFCLRNVTHLPMALQEARRVLKPGGRFLCLEFSTVALPILSEIYDLYSFQVLPILGQMVARDRESYQYLAESIRRFPNQAAFSTMIAGAGLEQVRHQNVSGGIAAIHSAWRL
ncbi:MAG: ubiquinone/menaquinone biosynthesis methyltransferase, partial [Rhodospirillales bacterium]|nr:ubiquinone/menaquinone biosynthesis methyltransferase [Rhodospirillales bacterium]